MEQKLLFIFVTEKEDIEYSNVEYSNVEYSNVEYSNVEYSNVEYSNVEYSNVEYSKEYRNEIPLSASICFHLLATNGFIKGVVVFQVDWGMLPISAAGDVWMVTLLR